MRVYRKLIADLLVGDYLAVVRDTSGLDSRPEWFRRVEKIEYIEASAGLFFANPLFQFGQELPPRAGPVIVWCHGVGAPLIYPAGDVSVWEDVPKERREGEAESRWWGELISEPLFAVSRSPTEAEVRRSELGDLENRRGAQWS